MRLLDKFSLFYYQEFEDLEYLISRFNTVKQSPIDYGDCN